MESNQPAPEQAAATTVSAPVRVLLAYSQKRAGINDVMRALTSHRGWLVPLWMFAQSSVQDRVIDGMLVLSAEAQITAGELWVFTDREAVFRAQSLGAMLGTYGGDMAGTELFRNIPQGTTIVRVNPGSPVEQTWMIQDGGGIEAGMIWADAIAFEDGFEQWQQTGRPDKTAFVNYRAFLTFDHVTGPVITLPNRGGMSNPAAAFTTPDCAETFLREIGEEQSAQLKQVTIAGRILLEKAPVLGIDGLIINVFGPGATYALPFSSFTPDS
jgi:hypothetical protein